MTAPEQAPSRWKGRPKAPPEDGVAIRVVVAAAVTVGIVAITVQGAVEPLTGALATVLAPAGYVLSYRRRHASGTLIKIAISIALMAALGQFLQTARAVTSVDQVRQPLAELFLWVQVLHAFDVPRRRDLAFSLVSSTTLIAAAGAVAMSTSFVWFLLVWAGLASGWLWLSSHPRDDEVARPVAIRRSGTPGARTRTATGRSLVAAALVALVLATTAFMAMPRLPGNVVRALPFSLGGDQATAVDDVYDTPNAPAPGGDGVVDFAPLAYPGFGARMDLRARGQLSQEIAFRVRADQAALWRGEVLDTFDGTGWVSSNEDRRSLTTLWEGDGLRVPEEQLPSRGSGTMITQTFTMAADQPNVVLAAATPERVYFPSGGLVVDEDGAIRSPITLDEGLIYSVVSELPLTDERVLAAAPRLRSTEGFERFLQLPAAMPERVGELARRIAGGQGTQLEVVRATEAWLRANTTYDLDVPREPAGVDAVDHFLFETRRGFCEHIASAMALLLRANGIPTRLVAGFGPGSRNPFTGYFEVRYADAHAWIEVYYAGVGWVPYDPTFGVPPAHPSWTNRFAAPEVFAAIGRVAGRAVPTPVKEALGTAGRAVAQVAGATLRSLPGLLALFGALGLTAFALDRRRRGDRAAAVLDDDVGLAFDELVAALGSAGHARGPSVTPSEFLREVAGDPDLEVEVRVFSDLVVRTFEARRYAAATDRPSDAEVIRARAAAARVRDLVARR